MLAQFKKLEKVAQAIAEADPNVIEVIIHQDKAQPPLEGEEIFLVCYLNHYEMTHDLSVYEEEAYTWEMDIAENIESVIKKLGLDDKDIIITPFNFELHRQDEYGQYFRTLFIKPGFEPVLKVADRELKKQEKEFDEVIETGGSDDLLTVESDDLQEEKLFTLSEVEENTGINKRTLQSYVKTGKIQGYKKNNRWVIPESEVRKFQGAESAAAFPVAP